MVRPYRMLLLSGLFAAASCHLALSLDDLEMVEGAGASPGGSGGHGGSQTGGGGSGGAGGEATGAGGTGTGGAGGTGTGGAGTGGTSTGTATGTVECATCSEYISDTGVVAEDLCGYQSTDPGSGMLVCDAGSSCELLADIQECECSGDSGAGTGCLDLCGDNECSGVEPTTACEDCVYIACPSEITACAGDT